MTAFILRRLLLAIPTLFGVLVVAFLVLHVASGDPVQAMVGERADSATVARLREQLHLDDPLIKRFGIYLGDIAKGDLGRSYITDRPISRDIKERFPKTLQLAGAAMLLAAILGVTLGILSAAKPGGFADRFALGLAYIGISFPVYWVGLLLILLFAVTLGWLPAAGSDEPLSIVLPAATLGAFSTALVSRMTRASMLEVLGQDFIRTAQAKGAPPRTVIIRHGLRNAFIPILTVISLQFGALLGGAVLTETVFGWPGIGRLLVDSIAARDFAVVQGLVLVYALLFVLLNVFVDVLYVVVDPRIRY